MSISLTPPLGSRVLATPLWPALPRPPAFVIAALVSESNLASPQIMVQSEVTYPGEGFEGVVLPECMNGRVKRNKIVLTWSVTSQRTLSLLPVHWQYVSLHFVNSNSQPLPVAGQPYVVGYTAFVDEQGQEATLPHFSDGAYVHARKVYGRLDLLLVSRPVQLLQQGEQVVQWTQISYSATWLVPPLDNDDMIPGCGGFQEGSGRLSEWADPGPDSRPDLENLVETPWREEAWRVRDSFPWHHFAVLVDEHNAWQVRAEPVRTTLASNLVLPHDITRMRNGLYTRDNAGNWQPPTATPLDTTPWQNQAETWAQEIDWQEVARLRGVHSGSRQVTVMAVGDNSPAWQVILTCSEGQKRWRFANQAICRMSALTPLPPQGWQETWQLLRASYHPLTGDYQETLVSTGTLTRGSDNPVYYPDYVVEARQG